MSDIDITANDRFVSFTATASQTVFPYDFPIFDTNQITVRRTRASIQTTLTEGADYTVSGAGDPLFGNVTLTTGATVSDIIDIVGETPLTRSADYANTGTIPSEDINNEFERLYMILQEQERDFAFADGMDADDIDDAITAAAAAAASAAAVAAIVAAAHSNRTLAVFTPYGNEPPATNYATLDTRNGHPCLDFDTTTAEAAVWSGVMPHSYSGSGITVYVHSAATSATSGTIGWTVEIERIGTAQDVDADSFASAATITAATVSGTSGIINIGSVNIASGAAMDSLAAGEAFRIRVTRDVANDNAAGDAEVYMVEIKEQ